MKHKREQSKIWSEYETINESMGLGGHTSFERSAVSHPGEDPNKDVELPGDHPNLFAKEELTAALKSVSPEALQAIRTHLVTGEIDTLKDVIMTLTNSNE